MRKCTNCSWEGEKLDRPYEFCPVCGDYTKIIGKVETKKKVEPKVNLDLNNDGKIDDKDASIASKVMNAVKGRKKKKPSRKKKK